jgi:hypothetical protein
MALYNMNILEDNISPEDSNVLKESGRLAAQLHIEMAKWTRPSLKQFEDFTKLFCDLYLETNSAVLICKKMYLDSYDKAQEYGRTIIIATNSVEELRLKCMHASAEISKINEQLKSEEDPELVPVFEKLRMNSR